MSRKVPELNLFDYLKEGSLSEDSLTELRLTDHRLTENNEKKLKFSKNLYEGLKDYGFIVLTGHPVSTELLDKSYALSKKLFSLDLETKKNYSMPENGHQRGYTPFGTEHAKNTKVADLKEFWHIGREGLGDLENFWPSEVEEFKSTFLELYGLLDQVGLALLEALTLQFDLPLDYFNQRVSRGNSILRLLHYPPIDGGVEKGALRAAPHEDINLITILVAATQSGLQLKDRDGQWLDVSPPKNSLIIDAGDMLSRITNEVIPSTTHQVINPDDKNTDRYSMPFFMHPNSDAILECIPACRGEKEKYPPISSDEFLKQRLKEIGL